MEYIHFHTIEEGDVFARTIINVIGRCCGGKGVCLRTSTVHVLLNNPKKFPMKIPLQTKHAKRTEDTICCVCYEDSEELTPCGHLVCKKCLPLVGPLCPCCRQLLRQ